MSLYHADDFLFDMYDEIKAECDRCHKLHVGVDANRLWASDAAMDAAQADNWGTPPVPTVGDFAIWCDDCLEQWKAEQEESK